ncbi:squalene/phytoene synthase family protein [Terasakiella sp. SH-1]|uniref:phytoene/squalene synthase family protein n=1 Tax=Terasakiella sp. SH-1 TaxID=2560057 RepID=UPI0010742389|nr:squalene/phytoene synthase family protein [Terasakiella sp. SH-1]
MTHAQPKDFKFVETIVKESKSSFAMGMKVLPESRRGYLYAIYAYCRVLDDIADEEDSHENKVTQLYLWRKKIDKMLNGEPSCEITRILADAVTLYHIPSIELYNLIDGMEMDANGPVHRPSWEKLYQYCRNVAVSVGLLSLPLFGRTDHGAEEFAIELGYALQFTNILRDIKEDEELGRVYLPDELLREHESFTQTVEAFATHTEAHYKKADEILKKAGKEKLLPALMMKAGYQKIFEKMKRRGWRVLSPRMRLSKTEKMFLLMSMLTRA